MRAPISIVIQAGDLAAALMSLGEGLEAGLICDVWLVGGAVAERELADAAGVAVADGPGQVAAKGAYLLDLPPGVALAVGWAGLALAGLEGAGLEGAGLEGASVPEGSDVALPLLVGMARLIRR